MLCSCWCMCVVDQIPVPKKISEIVLMSARSVSLLQDNGNQRMSQLPFQGAANPASCKELAKAAWKRVQPVMLFENNNCTLRSFNFYKKNKNTQPKTNLPPKKRGKDAFKNILHLMWARWAAAPCLGRICVFCVRQERHSKCSCCIDASAFL